MNEKTNQSSETEKGQGYFLHIAIHHTVRNPFFRLSVENLRKLCVADPDIGIVYTPNKFTNCEVTIVCDTNHLIDHLPICARINNKIFKGFIVIAGKSDEATGEPIGLTFEECNEIYEQIEFPVEQDDPFEEVDGKFEFRSSQQLETFDRRPLA